ncbi:MAG: 2-phosphosulfolactate phosphatase [Bacteroidales bacterium]
MTVDIIFTAISKLPSDISNKTIVVVDVLRASSVICTALANGAKNIHPVLSTNEAFERLRNINAKNTLLVGERNALPINGFDLGNSPLLFTKEVVKNKSLIMTTSNGTRAIRNAQGADCLYIASFLNAGATIERLTQHQDIIILCSGTNGEFALEDSLCAGLIAFELTRNQYKLSDAALAMSSLYISQKDHLQDFASRGRHYQYLLSLGLQPDLDYCFNINIINIIPRLHKDGTIQAK